MNCMTSSSVGSYPLVREPNFWLVAGGTESITGKKKKVFIFMLYSISVMIENNAKEKLPTVLLSPVVLNDVLAPLN